MKLNNTIQKNMFNYINEFLSITDLDILLEKICVEAPKIINGKECSIFLIPDLVKDKYNGQLANGKETIILASEFDEEFIVLAKTTRENFKHKIGKAFYCKGQGLTGWIFQEKKPLILKDMKDENELRKFNPIPEWTDTYKGAETHFDGKGKMPFIGVPLLKGDTSLGVIRIGETREGNSFPPYSLDLIMSFAAILANLIEKITLTKNLKDSLNSLIKLGAIRDESGIFNATVEEAASLVGAENCDLFLLDKFGEKIELNATNTEYMEELKKKKKCKPYKRGDGLTGWVFKTGKPLRLENIRDFKNERYLSDYELKSISDNSEINNEDDRKIKWLDQDEEYKHRSIAFPYYLGVPIKSDIGEVIGVLRVSSPRAKTFFNKMDMELLLDFSNNISSIYQNLRQKKLYNVLIEIGNIYKKDSLFDYVVNEVPGLVLGRGCSIFLKQQGLDITKKIVLAYTNSPELKTDEPDSKIIDLHYDYGEGKTGFVADIKRSLLINYYGSGRIQEKKLANNFLKYTKNPNYMVHYLKDKEGNNVGIIRIFKRKDEPEFSKEDKKKFDQFCTKHIYEEGGLPSNKQAKCETGAGGYAQSFLAVPIKLKSKTEDLLGVLRIPRRQEGGRFSDDDLVLVESITGRLTTALKIESDRANTRENLQIIRDINSKINSAFDKDIILEEILKAITEKLGYEFACIQLINEKKDTIDTVKVRKNSTLSNPVDPQGWLGASHPLHPPKGQKKDIHVYVLMELEKAIVIEGWDDHFDKSIFDQFNHKVLIRAFVPIIVVEPKTGEQIKIGTLETGHNIKRKNFIDPQELEILDTVANQVALTIWNREQIWSKVISTASHQLRNHFTTIKINLEPTLGGAYGPLNDNQKKRLKAAVEGICEYENLLTNLLNLVSIVREMSSIEKGNYIDLSKVIKEIGETFEYRLEKMKISLKYNMNIEGIKVWGDANKIKHVLVNLVENAIKFTPEKGRITIAADNFEDYIKITINDTGKGIPENIKDTLFLPFTRDEYSSNNTGLGLSIAKNFVELHGGEIWAESEIGKGSSFMVMLPKRKKEK
jgi:signal transduction histidine kinase